MEKPLPDVKLNAFESELFELFDKYQLKPREAARECLFVASDILSALGDDPLERLYELQAHIEDLQVMVSSTLLVLDSPDGPRLASLGTTSWRAAEEIPRWRCLDELSEEEA